LPSAKRWVQAVKAEVDHVHQISSRSKADLNFVTEHRSEVATLRTQVEDLLGRVTETDQKIAAIEARRKVVEDVQSRANAITRLLDDLNVNLEMLGEQKAVIDHVGREAGASRLRGSGGAEHPARAAA
jgi:phage shock protein A